MGVHPGENPDYSDTLYVTELVAPNTVNTMPEKTLDAVTDHGVIKGDTVTGTGDAAQEVFDKLEAVGIDLTDVFVLLERTRAWRNSLSPAATCSRPLRASSTPRPSDHRK